MNIQDLKDQAGRLIIAGFEGTTLPSEIGYAAESGCLGGIVLFKRNVETPAQVQAMLFELQARSPKGKHLIIAVDQEGGRVARLQEPLTVLPPARRFGEINNPDLTRTAGKLVGAELSSLGFNMNFAPVLDVNTNPDSPIIGDRAYGDNVETVIKHGFAFAQGLCKGGVNPCAKHFPGHGDASVDSHLDLPLVEHDRARLEQIELEPFAAWARTGLGPIMTAHIVFSSLDPDNPATSSRAILTKELRERLHFGGVVLTDDLEMGAVNSAGGTAAVAIKAIMAGANGLLICRNDDLRTEVIATLAHQASVNPVLAARMISSEAKLATLIKPPGPTPDINWIDSKEHNRLKNAFYKSLSNVS